jgi:hypothetical protein
LSPEELEVLRMTHLYRPMGGPPIPGDFDAREYNPWALEQVLAAGSFHCPASIRRQPMIFSADETADVGIDLATPVVETIGSEAKSRFTGKIPKVTIEVK